MYRSPRLLTAVLAALSLAGWAGTGAASAAPNVSAPAAIAVEPATGDVVFSRNASSERAIASTTKLMTALVTIENTDLDDVVTTVPYSGLAVESTGGFRGGERVSIRTLLRALLVASANDAAATLAVRVGGSREKFVAMMNKRARTAGLTHTHFSNPIGLDAPGNYSSATDLVKIALLLRRDPFIRETTDRKAVTITSGGRSRTLRNRNLLIGRVPFIDGVKTGHTQGAGWVLVGSGTRKGVTLLTAVLGASSESARMQDTLAMMRYGLARYEVVPAVTVNRVYAKVKLANRDETVSLVAAKAVDKTVRKGGNVSLRADVPPEVNGPLAAGARVGTVNVVYDGRVAEKVPLVTAAPVSFAASTGSFWDKVFGPIGAFIGIAALCTLVILLLRHRAAKRRQRVAAADSEARIA